MTTAIGVNRSQRNWKVEQAHMAEAIRAARALFNEYPDGVAEDTLILRLKREAKLKLWLAAAAVDRLEASGVAVKDWSTGQLSHPGDRA